MWIVICMKFKIEFATHRISSYHLVILTSFRNHDIGNMMTKIDIDAGLYLLKYCSCYHHS